MLNNKIETEVLEIMKRKLINDDLQSRANHLYKAVEFIKSASYSFKQAGFNKQSDNLNEILNVINKALSNKINYSFKEVAASIDNEFNYITNNAEDLLNLDIGDINLTDDELNELEHQLLNEVHLEEADDMTFEDELN